MGNLCEAISFAFVTLCVLINPVEAGIYIPVCDEYGSGFLMVGGNNICSRFGGSISHVVSGGADIHDGSDDRPLQSWTTFTAEFDSRTATDGGLLRSYFEVDFDSADSEEKEVGIADFFIGYGGWKIGYSESLFDDWFDWDYGLINDDVIAYAGDMSPQISYSGRLGDGYSYMVGLEFGAEADLPGVDPEGEEPLVIHTSDDQARDDLPLFVGGLRVEREWGTATFALGYDTVADEAAAKIRLDLQLDDAVTVFAMLGRQTNSRVPNYYGAWNGDHAIWLGFFSELTPSTMVNFQAAYEAEGSWAVGLDVDYLLAPNLVVTPEINFTCFAEDRSSMAHALGAMIKLEQRF